MLDVYEGKMNLIQQHRKLKLVDKEIIEAQVKAVVLNRGEPRCWEDD